MEEPIDPRDEAEAADDKATAAPPPNDLEAEADLLGELLNHPDLVPIALGLVEAGDFYSATHGKVFEAIAYLDDAIRVAGEEAKGAKISIGLIRAYIRDRGKAVLTDQDAQRYLLELRDLRPSVWDRFEEVCQRVRDKSRLRATAQILAKAQADLYLDNGPLEAQEWLEELRATVTAHAQQGAARTSAWIGDASATTDGAIARPTGLRGISTGLSELDELTGGWQRGDTWIVTGPPGGGKTAFGIAQCLACTTTEDPDGQLRSGAIMFSMEMPRSRAELRARCNLARVNLRTARAQPERLTDDERSALRLARDKLQTLPLLVDDRKGLTVDQIRSATHQARVELNKRGARLELVVADYYQLTGDNPRAGRGPTRERELNLNGLELVHLSEELNVPLLLLAQLTADGQRIAECSAMQRHAQNWVQIALGKLVDARDKDGARDATLKIRKQRDGGEGKVQCFFTGAFQRFTEDEWS